jgi:hypothetical protein
MLTSWAPKNTDVIADAAPDQRPGPARVGDSPIRRMTAQQGVAGGS